MKKGVGIQRNIEPKSFQKIFRFIVLILSGVSYSGQNGKNHFIEKKLNINLGRSDES